MAKKVQFTLSAEVVGEATSGLLLGEFNNWDYNEGIELQKQKDGSMSASAALESGKRYEYRYLLNDGRWVNDGSAHQYVHISGLHVDNCVVNVAEDTNGTEKTAAKESKIAEVPAAEKVKVAVKKVTAPKEKVAAPKADNKEKVVAEKVVAEKVTAPAKVKATPKPKTPKA